MRCKRFLLLLLLLSLSRFAVSQSLKFQIQSLEDNKTTTIRKGNFLQCIQFDIDRNEIFAFGKVLNIEAEGVMLETNPFIKGSGGFIYFKDIRNIEKLDLVKRSILAACVGGYIIGQLTVIGQIPDLIGPPLAGAAAAIILVKALKHKKKSLYENRVNESIILLKPENGGNNAYFE